MITNNYSINVEAISTKNKDCVKGYFDFAMVDLNEIKAHDDRMLDD